MKKLIYLAALVLVVGGGAAYAFKNKGPSQREIEDAISASWNVKEVPVSSWFENKLLVQVAWKDPSRAQDASSQICQYFPEVRSVIWDDSDGDPHRRECQ